MKRFILSAVLICLGYKLAAQADKLLPKPQVLSLSEKYVGFERIHIDAPLFASELEEFFLTVDVKVDSDAPVSLTCRLDTALQFDSQSIDESYKLKVSPGAIEVSAPHQKGLYYGIQTLKQLVVSDGKGAKIQELEIKDWPAFRIRGFMHDVGRSFISVEELKQQIKILSSYKINVFHWHLTEDLAWRLESEVFPALTDSSNFERFPGKYYTKKDVRELLDFARQHQVTVIPEIDMPGHSEAFKRALGHNMQSEEGMAKLKLLMKEIGEVFAGVPYIHIGTDEVQFTNPDFVPEMVEYVRDLGFKVISWNPGWEYQVGEIDMLHLWSYRGKITPGIPAIDSKFHYINHFDPFADLASLYRSNVIGFGKGTDDVAGAILAIWNDRKLKTEDRIISENNFYPLMLTFAERLWQGGGEGYFDQVGVGLPPRGTVQYVDFIDFEDRLLFHQSKYFENLSFPYVKQAGMKWKITEPFPNDGQLSKSFPPEEALADEYVYKGKSYTSKDAEGAGIYLRHVWGKLVPAFYQDPQPNHTAYAYTWIYSPREQELGAWISFQDYSRSEKDLAPPQGEWDYKNSQIWINDRAVAPPVWENTHSQKTNEIPLANENFHNRPPTPIKLEEGWNKVLLKLPVGEFQTPEVRLVKWMFNFALFDFSGKEVEGLVYDPDYKTDP